MVERVSAEQIREYRDRLDAASHLVAQVSLASPGVLVWLFIAGAAKRRRMWAQSTLVLWSVVIVLMQGFAIVSMSRLWPLHLFIALLHVNAIHACVRNRPREEASA
ncbi:MAG: hypothetical protein AB8I08_18530 [Sandaracinaceae bacterium]